MWVGGQRLVSWAPGQGTKRPLYWSEGAMGSGMCQILDPSGAAPTGPPVQVGMQPGLGDSLVGTGRPDMQAAALSPPGPFPLLPDLERANASASWPPSTPGGAPTVASARPTGGAPPGHVRLYYKMNWGQGN